MREILFKAKRIDNNEWVEGLITVMWGQYHIVNPNDENTAYPIDTETICQFTGLTDKNGNKIWENDLMCFRTEYDGTTHKIAVTYEKGCYWCNFSDTAGSALGDISHRCENIGNVFDNLELM